MSNELLRIVQSDEQIYSFNGIGRFKVGTERRLVVEADKKDVKRTTKAIKIARQNAYLVIVSINAHNQGGYLEKFAHECIDAGADCFFGAGPHFLTGLEIYKEKPIFYSLGNFIFELQTLKQLAAEVYEFFGLDGISSNTNDFFYLIRGRQSQENWWLTVAPWIIFSNGKLEEVTLYPISLNLEAERPGAHGRPSLADEETSKKIIETMRTLSSAYGTQISYLDGVGRVKIK